jgi:small subunit ribosomal protein S8
MTDPISDLLTRIRNAARARKNFVHVPFSQMKESIAQVLKQAGYVSSVQTTGEGVAKELLIELSEAHRDITLKSVSKPGQRIYVKSQEIPRVLSGLGLAIISTPKGIMSGTAARKAKVGGEFICEIY